MRERVGAFAVAHLVLQLRHSSELKRKPEQHDEECERRKSLHRQVHFHEEQDAADMRVEFVERDLVAPEAEKQVQAAAAAAAAAMEPGAAADIFHDTTEAQEQGSEPEPAAATEVFHDTVEVHEQAQEQQSVDEAYEQAHEQFVSDQFRGDEFRDDAGLVGDGNRAAAAAAAFKAGASSCSSSSSSSGTEDHKQQRQYEDLVAHIGLTSGGLAKRIELYGDYVARQIGLTKNTSVARELSEAAMAYLNGDKSQSDRSRENVLGFLSRACKSLDDQQLMSLNEQLVKELDASMVSYFAFHWKHSAHLLDQVRTGERKLRNVVMAATRKHRFQRAMAVLKGKRAFTTLVETIKAMGKRQVVHDEQGRRAPVLLLVGGGMGAGKSTVVKNILSGSAPPIVRPDAVVVEADAFKETDALYRALSSSGSGDISMASQVVHDSSTRAASSLLVSALNEGRDVVFDGTMSWEPFVMQTIEMARDVHRHRYRLGPGYQVNDDGTVVEQYWERVQAVEEEQGKGRSSLPRAAYRIELVAVTSDALLAVVRGIRRAIITNRFVPVNGQLRSHKLFAASLEKYCTQVDAARVFCTTNTGVPQLIGSKEGPASCLKWVDSGARRLVKELSELNSDASSVLELGSRQCKSWAEIALAPDRPSRQQNLRELLLNSTMSPLVTPVSSSLQLHWEEDSSSSSNSSRSSSSSTSSLVGGFDSPSSLSSSSLSSLTSSSSGSSGASSPLAGSSSSIDIASLEDDF